MPDPIRERMDALTSANLRMLRRLEALERRVAELEGLPAEPAGERDPGPEPVPPEPAPVEPPREPEQQPAPGFEPEPARRQTGLGAAEAAVGLNWVNRIGALTLVIGAAFFFKYAVDNEWIGPAGRILLGLLAGLLVSGYGLRSWLRGHSIFAQGVSAVGLALLYLTIWASYSLYKLVPALLAFPAMLAVTLLGAAFAWRFGAIAMAALGMVGGYSTPFLLSSGEYRPWFFSSYMFMLNAGWLILARNRGWVKLEWLAAAFTGLSGAAFFESLRADDQGPAGAFSLLTQYAVFAASPVPWLVYAAQLVAGFGLAVAWEDHVWQAGGLCLAVLASGLALTDRRKLSPLPLVSWSAFTAGFCILYAEYSRPVPAWPLLLVATIGFLIAFGYTALRMFNRPSAPGRFELLMLITPGLCYFLEGYALLSVEQGVWRGLFAAALAAVFLAAGWWLWRSQPGEARDRRPVVFCAGASLVLITAALALQFSGFRITMLWAAEAAALAWLASRYELPSLRIPVALLSAFLVFRLLAIDAPAFRDHEALRLLANLRFLTCAVSAAALACAALLLRKSWTALIPYLGAHAALLAGFGLENYSWVMRAVEPSAQVSAIAAGLDVVGALYGLALVVAGVASRTRLNRLLGLSLLAMVVLKLYFADVWLMDRLARIIAFSALGLLLLATSFFYSRFRARIQAWMQDDPMRFA
jgi:uncharacterized membrane protein